MTLDELRARCEEVRREWSQASTTALTPAAVEDLRVRFLGRKGLVTAAFDALRTLPPDARAPAGRLLNSLKEEIATAIEARQAKVERETIGLRLAAEQHDFTRPGKWRPMGRLHPLTQVRLEIEDIFMKLGFDVASGPEVETDYYNFEALAIGADHPARDDWDSFYIADGLLLRTHTSPVQIRVMKSQAPPVRIVCPGRCYRRDNPDATHSPVFHQIELLWVEKGLTFAHLKWILGEFVNAFFGPGYEMRISADFFPFTEPSAQVHIRRQGQARATHHAGGWLEIMGAGMVDPAVLTGVGYDPEEVTGFAFGLGVERMAMLRWGIEDIRLFSQNDIRFLSRF